jgi:hypothetical protein
MNKKAIKLAKALETKLENCIDGIKSDLNDLQAELEAEDAGE